MSWWFIYWITRLDGIEALLTACIIFSSAFTVVRLMLWAIPAACRYSKDNPAEREENDGYTIGEKQALVMGQKIKLAPIVLAISIALIILIPNLKEAAAIYLIPKMVNNENVQELPNDATKLLRLKLNEWINDLTEVPEKE